MSKLFYVIGASGTGKDSLMSFARQNAGANSRILFAHRYITRATDGSENYISLTESEFHARNSAGLFALHWHSHGNYYGIGAEINLWMEKGFKVVVNGSREYLPAANKIFSQLVPIVVVARQEIIRQRLFARGREDALNIEKRINRSDLLDVNLDGAVIIHNNGALSEAGDEFLRILRT